MLTHRSTKHHQLVIPKIEYNNDIKSIRINSPYLLENNVFNWNEISLHFRLYRVILLDCTKQTPHKYMHTSHVRFRKFDPLYKLCILFVPQSKGKLNRKTFKKKKKKNMFCTCAKPSSQIIDKASNYSQFRENDGVQNFCANSVFPFCLRLNLKIFSVGKALYRIVSNLLLAPLRV